NRCAGRWKARFPRKRQSLTGSSDIFSLFGPDIARGGVTEPVTGQLHSSAAFGIGLPVAGASVAVNSFGCGCSSVVEHDLAKVGVEGSSPFARSKSADPASPRNSQGS